MSRDKKKAASSDKKQKKSAYQTDKTRTGLPDPPVGAKKGSKK